MKILVWISRIFVGILFIISGFVKLNDPLGFSFKLEEYFSLSVLNIPFLIPYALAISIFVLIFETVLGIMLLLGYKPKFTVWNLLLLIVFFTFLTFYSAYYNKVTDCGCFGDAIKFTPWQSFTKDIVLLVFIFILFIGYKYITPLFSKKVAFIGSVIGLIVSIWFVYHVLNHLPSIDFRAYKVGTNIQEGMKIPENAPLPVYEYNWKFIVDGKEKNITTLGGYPTVDGEFVGVETQEIQKGYEPPIHDFAIERNGEDYTQTLLEEPYLLMVISFDLLKAHPKGLKQIKTITDNAMQAGYKVIGMSASSQEEAQQIKNKNHLQFDFYFTDETTLKTIIRANPGIVVVHKGTIMQKIHYNDIHKINLNQDR